MSAAGWLWSIKLLIESTRSVEEWDDKPLIKILISWGISIASVFSIPTDDTGLHKYLNKDSVSNVELKTDLYHLIEGGQFEDLKIIVDRESI